MSIHEQRIITLSCDACGESFRTGDGGVLLFSTPEDARNEAAEFGWTRIGDADRCGCVIAEAGAESNG